MEFHIIYEDINSWCIKTFGKNRAIASLHHLKEQIEEIIQELGKENVNVEDCDKKYADAFILLINSAASYGMDANDVLKAISIKMDINRGRRWGSPDDNGICKHLKE